MYMYLLVPYALRKVLTFYCSVTLHAAVTSYCVLLFTVTANLCVCVCVRACVCVCVQLLL